MVFDNKLPEISVGEHEVCVVSCVYNEELRFPDFLRHHRAIGVNRFFIVDNSSTDRTPHILQSANDVVYLKSSGTYKENRKTWLKTICSKYLINRWALFLDADELFVYNGWPHRSIHDLVRDLANHGEQGLFSPMVDMYSHKNLNELNYNSDSSLINVCPNFDSKGYYIVRASRDVSKDWPTPPCHVYGGPRNRVFQFPENVGKTSHWILNKLYGLNRNLVYSPVERFLIKRTTSLLRKVLPSPRPIMSKVPLVLWQENYRYHRGPHYLNTQIKLSEEWGALLHFKYLQDFPLKVSENVFRKQHAELGRYYRIIEDAYDDLFSITLMNGDSRIFSGTSDLVNLGLMRTRGPN